MIHVKDVAFHLKDRNGGKKEPKLVTFTLGELLKRERVLAGNLGNKIFSTFPQGNLNNRKHLQRA